MDSNPFSYFVSGHFLDDSERIPNPENLRRWDGVSDAFSR